MKFDTVLQFLELAGALRPHEYPYLVSRVAEGLQQLQAGLACRTCQ
jgi:hypothetical protein